MALTCDDRRQRHIALVETSAFAQLAARIQEAMIGRYRHLATLHFRREAPCKRAKRIYLVGARLEHVVFRRDFFACGIDLVVVQVHHGCTFDERLSLLGRQIEEVLDAQGPCIGSSGAQNRLAL